MRLDVPGHSGSAVAQPELAELFGERLLELDLPPLVDGTWDQGPAPRHRSSRRDLHQRGGARRTWLVTNGASKGNLVACLALRHLGEHVVVQRSMHSSVMDGMVLGGLVGHYVQLTWTPRSALPTDCDPKPSPSPWMLTPRRSRPMW